MDSSDSTNDNLSAEPYKWFETSTDGKGLCVAVRAMAHEIFKELQRLIAIYGNGFLDNLMPLIVSTLETLDVVYSEKNRFQESLSSLSLDHKHLVSEYEKEKAKRRTAESLQISLEYHLDEERKLFVTKQSQSEGLINMLESKVKNFSEQMQRLEDREAELVRANKAAKDRYNLLVRSYFENIEKLVSSPPLGEDFSDLYNRFNVKEIINIDSESSVYNIKLPMESFPDPNFDELSQTDLSCDGDDQELKSIDACSPNTPQFSHPNAGDSLGFDLFSGVTREVKSLIKENQELLQTKEALNVVIKDLINRMDELTYDCERLTCERNTLIGNTTSMLLRIKGLEQENHRFRSIDSDSFNTGDSLFSSGVTGDTHWRSSVPYLHGEQTTDPTPFSMRRLFTRLEMARVLLERNTYKEQLIELQDVVRWTERLRSSKRTRKNWLWRLFSRLFQTPESATVAAAPVVGPTGLVIGEDLAATLPPEVDLCRRQLHLASSTPLSPFKLVTEVSDSSGNRHCTSSVSNSLDVSLSSVSQQSSWHPHPSDPSSSNVSDWIRIDTASSLDIEVRPRLSSISPLVKLFPGLSSENAAVFLCACTASFPSNWSELREPKESSWLLPQRTSIRELSTVSNSFHNSFCVPPTGSSDKASDGPKQCIWLCWAVRTCGTDARPFVTIHITGLDPSRSDSAASFGQFRMASGSGKVSSMTVVPECSREIFRSLREPSWDNIPSCQNASDSATQPPTTSSDMHSTRAFSYRIERRRFTSGERSLCRSSSVLNHAAVPDAPSYDSTLSLTTVWLGCDDGHLMIHSLSSVNNQYQPLTCTMKLSSRVNQLCYFHGHMFASLANGSVLVFRRQYVSKSQEPRLPSESPSSSQEIAQTGYMSWDLCESCVITLPQSSNQPETVPSPAGVLCIVPCRNAIWTAIGVHLVAIDAFSLQLLNHTRLCSPTPGNLYVHVQCMTHYRDGVWLAMHRDPVLRLLHVDTQCQLQTVDISVSLLQRVVAPLATTSASVIHSDKPHKELVVSCLLVTKHHLWVGTDDGYIAILPFGLRESPVSLSDVSGTREHERVQNDDTDNHLALVRISDMQISQYKYTSPLRLLVAVQRDTFPQPTPAKIFETSSAHPVTVKIDTPTSSTTTYVVCLGECKKPSEYSATSTPQRATSGMYALTWRVDEPDLTPVTCHR